MTKNPPLGSEYTTKVIPVATGAKYRAYGKLAGPVGVLQRLEGRS